MVQQFILTNVAVLDTTASQPPYLVQIQLPGSRTTAAEGGRWRLVRTPGPEKGADIVSVMRTGDALRSDADFAGLVVRCREKAGFQVGLVVIRPFPPRSRPQIVLSDGRSETRFQASVLPSGSMLSLPDEAEALVKGPWQTAKELTVDIDGDGGKIRGIVPLGGLPEAINVLLSVCRTQ